MELWLRAGELGHAGAYSNVSRAYLHGGQGVERDQMELAAMGGDVWSRHNLGVNEERVGNYDRAVKHWMISAGAGYDDSLKTIRECFIMWACNKR